MLPSGVVRTSSTTVLSLDVEVSSWVLYNRPMSEHREFTPENVERDNLVDKAFFYSMLPVREFARMMKVAPQLVYYRIRTGKVKLHTCTECGREGLVPLDAIRTFRATPQDVQEAAQEYGVRVEPGEAEVGSGDVLQRPLPKVEDV